MHRRDSRIVVLAALSGWPAGARRGPNNPSAASALRAPGGAASAVLRRYLSLLQLPRGHACRPDRRELTAMHTDIVLKHDETHRWCLDCHDAANRDVLHLASGERVPVRGILPRSAASATAKSTAIGVRAFTAAAPATGTAPRVTCCAAIATIRTSRASTRWRPSPRRGRPAGT